jgi:hypothetical protein
MNGPPPNGSRIAWYSPDGSVGFIGHWQDGVQVQDRRMTWLEFHGGGSAVLGFAWVAVAVCLYMSLPLAVLYAIVRFVKWVR